MTDESKPSSNIKYVSDRELGLAHADANEWNLALVYLNHAARAKLLTPSSDLLSDLVLLDALGEAAYRNETPEALGPYQNYYKYPSIATHMARAFLMLGDLKSCQEFLGYAKDSALKAALFAMTEMGSDIQKTAEAMLPVAEKYPDLYYPEYWRALAAVADAVKNEKLTKLAERKSKHFAYKDPNIHFNQALRMLGQGEFQAGWRLYDWRLVPGASQSNRTELGKIPMWEGEKLAGKTLLIFLEQGLGDCLFSLRYVNHFLRNKIAVQIIARPSLIEIVQSSFPGVPVFSEDDVADFDYWQTKHTHALPDYWVYALSIPYRANLTAPQLTDAYLKIPANILKLAEAKIKELNPEKLPIYSLNWHGRIDTEADRTRAFSATEFYTATGLSTQRCFLISVQKDATATEIEQLSKMASQSGSIVFNASDFLTSFAETAAFISCSQRLVTNDTSVAHLAGAIGHPTTVLARNKAIWQWLRKDFKNPQDSKIEKSIWYDSVDIQYAMTPEISWLFTTTKKDHPFPAGATNEGSVQQEKLQLGNPNHSSIRKKIRFAGQPES